MGKLSWLQFAPMSFRISTISRNIGLYTTVEVMEFLERILSLGPEESRARIAIRRCRSPQSSIAVVL